MRGSRLFYALPVLILVGLSRSWPSPPVPPRSVSEGEEGIKHIWQSAWDGHIENILPERFGHLQGAWAEFLTSQGAGIVESYYK